MILPDVLKSDLKVVFCGTAAGNISAARGEYYANPTNKFWRTLAEIGLTPRLLKPREFLTLLDFGIGLTDLVKDQKGSDIEIKRQRWHRQELIEKISRYQPGVLAFNGKTNAEHFFDRSVHYGFVDETLGSTRIYVLPSTSGAASGYWDKDQWQNLAKYLNSLKK